MTGRSTQPRKAQRGSGRCELPQTSCRSSPRAVNPTVYPDIPSRLQRQFHVTGTQYISTDKVQSQTLNTGGTAEDYFSPWAISPGRFLLYLDIRGKIPFDPNIIYICHIKPATPHSAESAQRHSAPCISQCTARKFICFRVHLQES